MSFANNVNCTPVTSEDIEKVKNEIGVDPKIWTLLKDLRNAKNEVFQICKRNKIPFAPYGLLLGQINEQECRTEVNSVMKILKEISKKKMNDIKGLHEICHVVSEYIN